jgi:hypothetical protein
MYEIWTYITKPIGNNAFSYDQRMVLWSTGKLYIPSLIAWTVADLWQGSEICFEEVINGKLVSCTGLKNFLQTTYHDMPVYIVDNHNYALSFRHKHFNISTSQPFNVIHIDQHSAIKPNENIFSPDDDIETFVNEKTNVGNFITAAINAWIIKDVLQVRSDYTLGNIQHETWNMQPCILDLDIDFRVDKEASETDFEIIRKLIQQSKLVTIATSPYFIEQNRAIEIIKKILSD